MNARIFGSGLLAAFVVACGTSPPPVASPPPTASSAAVTAPAPVVTAPAPVETAAPKPDPAPAPAPASSLVLTGNIDAHALDLLALPPREQRVRVTFTSLKPGGATEALEVTFHGGLYELRIERDNAATHTAETETAALDAKQAKPFLDRIEPLLAMAEPKSDPNVEDGASQSLVVEKKQADGKMRVHALTWTNAKDVPAVFLDAKKELAKLAAKEGKRVKLSYLK